MAGIAERPNGHWRTRYRDPRGKEHSRHFDRKIDAQNWLDSVVTAIQTGAYVDPNRSRITVEAMARQWFDGKVSLRPAARAVRVCARQPRAAAVARCAVGTRRARRGAGLGGATGRERAVRR